MIFARESDAALARLVKQIDGLVAKHADAQMGAFVNFIGDDPDKLQANAKKLAGKIKIENVALVVPVENQNGPPDFNISAKAGTTVMMYRGLEVKVNRVIPLGGLNKKAIGAILNDTAKILE